MLNPKPETLNPKSSTAMQVTGITTQRRMNSGQMVTAYKVMTSPDGKKWDWVNPQPSTLNPQPHTLNPKPSTINPTP